MTPHKICHSEWSSVIRTADGGTQSRNLLLDGQKSRFSTPQDLSARGQILLRSK